MPTTPASAAESSEPFEDPAPFEERGLSAADRGILELEGQLWKYTATKERAIREQLGIEPTDYYLRLRQLMTDPAARRAYPALLSRLDGMLERARRRYAPSSGGRGDLPQPPQNTSETP